VNHAAPGRAGGDGEGSPGRITNGIALATGLLFGAGLLISGMTQPSKVIGFLDVLGSWDPSLLLVMAGAISVHMVAYQVARRRKKPLLTAKWAVPSRRDIDSKLVIGAAIFGMGWGLSGYCPGPAVLSAATGGAKPLIFVAAMVVGMFVAANSSGRKRLRPRPRERRIVA